MTEIKLKVKRASEEDLVMLEDLSVLKRLIGPKNLQIDSGEIEVKKIYSSNPKYGGHKLIYVNTNKVEGKLAYHPDNEDILLTNPYESTKPLIWIFCKYHKDELLEKIFYRS